FCATARGGRGLKLWKLAGLEPSQIPVDGQLHVTAVFSPDSGRFAIGLTDGVIDIYDLPSGRRIRRLETGVEVRHLAFHPRTRQLAVALPDGVQVGDLDTGGKLVEFRVARTPWPFVAWHPDGKTLGAVGGDSVIRLWDVATGKEVAKLEGHKNQGVEFT